MSVTGEKHQISHTAHYECFTHRVSFDNLVFGNQTLDIECVCGFYDQLSQGGFGV